MKFKQLAIVIGLCVLFIIASFLSKNAGEGDDHPNVFKDFPVDKVSSMIIRDKNRVIYLNKKHEIWFVDSSNSYSADNQKINRFLDSLNKMKSDGNQIIADEHFDRFEINDPEKKTEKSGIKISFYAANGSLIDYLILGKRDETTNIRYVYAPEDKILARALNAFGGFSTKPMDWLNSYFISITDIVRQMVNANGLWSEMILKMILL